MASKAAVKSEEDSSTALIPGKQETHTCPKGRDVGTSDERLGESNKHGTDRYRELETRKAQVIRDVGALMEEFGILSVENVLAVISPHMSLFARRTQPSQHGKDILLRLQNNPNPCRVLGVFGLSSDTTDKDLRYLFEAYGPLTGVQLEYSRGYAFVCYKDVDDAIVAKTCCDDAEVNGRRISCQHFYHKGSCTRIEGTPCALFNCGPPASLDTKLDDKTDSGSGVTTVVKLNSQAAPAAIIDTIPLNGATSVNQSKGIPLRNNTEPSSPVPQREVLYTISSTGKRHYKTCAYFGCGRPCSATEGIPCFYCKGGPLPQPSFEYSP